MIADENEDRVVSQMLLFQDLPDSSYRSIDRLTATVVVRQLRLPVSRKRAQVGRHKRILKALCRTLGRDKPLGVVLEMWLQLRDIEQERLVVRVAEKLLRAIGHEVDAKLIFEGDLFAVPIVDGAFVGMGREFKLVGALPHIEKPGAILRFGIAAS